LLLCKKYTALLFFARNLFCDVPMKLEQLVSDEDFLKWHLRQVNSKRSISHSNVNYDVINDVISGFAKVVVQRCGFHHWIAQRISCGEVVSVFYSARNARIASAVLATAIPSVCQYVRLSHAGIVSKRRHVARCSFHRWIGKCV